MNFSGITMLKSRSNVTGIGAACLFGGLAAATLAAPAAIAAPADQCSASGLANTVSTVVAMGKGVSKPDRCGPSFSAR